MVRPRRSLLVPRQGYRPGIVRYYKDNSFNVGVADNDDMQAVTSVEFIDAQPGMS